MTDFNFLLLHVQDHAASAVFYRDLLGQPILQQKDDFAMLPLRDGVMLGLWNRNTVEPQSPTEAGSSEITFAVPDDAALERTHAEWRGRGAQIIQPPTPMPFGLTFAARDPDGHRLRVFAPPA